ncbi:hypothetical protein DFQ14_103260 [Halopolyspora algeriensis]|uniref:Small secreted domain DUF320 n=1 Tax=Halopolyspora algeriensis TaxID=1500506 RepID=A0A368VTZ9_9ACTN|nr:hypothetical protein [Halopolyspora algeriensis]RCW45291.1 hypothetical protein DFQ14_103260 [Halopolyspora algeriensis]TQM47331.1 hypothetical protein FHU43_3316 [Halopolyspora algeriensis]
MRPWTTRTLNAAVVAAGFATATTGTASAADTANPGLPDLSQVPDDLGITAPLHTCQTPAGTLQKQTMGSCADVTLKAEAPNPVKKVGADIATTARGTAGEMLSERSSLPSVQPGPVLGHVAKAKARVEQLVDSRPTVGVEAETTSAGRSNERGKHAKLLEAEVGPRHPGHEGVSAADTAVDLTAAQGGSIEPLKPVGAVVSKALQSAPSPSADGRANLPKTLQDAPPQASDSRANLPRIGEILPAHKHTPALAALDNGLTGVTSRADTTDRGGETLPGTGTPVGTPSDALPIVGSVPNPGSALGL